MGAVFKLSPEELDRQNRQVNGKVKGHEFYNMEDRLVGYSKGEEIYTATHTKVAYAKIGNVYSASNKKMISLEDAKQMMNCKYDGVTLAGYWYFFRPKNP